jgi:chromosome partitioning protein
MARTVAVVNQKGGVGKTTTAVNLGASLAAKGCRVLLVDFDPQGNASSGTGYPRDRIELSIYDALIGDVALTDVIRPTEITTLFVVPANTDLVGAEVELISASGRERFLADLLAPVAEQFDFILIDCPPSLGVLTLNALVAADSVVVPMQAEYYALEGLSSLIGTIERVKQSFNPRLSLEGVVFCMYDNRTNLSGQVRNEVTAYLGDKVFQTSIPRNVKLSESPSHGKPVLLYDMRCAGAQSYLEFAGEFLARFPATGSRAAKPSAAGAAV